MRKIHLIVTKIDKEFLTATAIIFDNENNFESTHTIPYKETDSDADILAALNETGDVIETLVGKRPPRRR